MDKHNPNWMIGGPWYNISICKKTHVKVFEELIRNEKTDRYNIMCSIYAHEKENPLEFYDGSSDSGYPLP